jgi:hypothetical protein
MAEMVSDDDVVRLTAVAALKCGQFAVSHCGRVGVVQNMEPVDIGEVATLKIRGIVKAPAGATLSAGVSVDVNLTAQTIIATGGAGTYLGKLLYDVTSGRDAFVDMNP